MNALNSAAACALGALAISALLAAPPASAQSPKEIQAALDAAHAKYKDIAEGANADYIPALAKVDAGAGRDYKHHVNRLRDAIKVREKSVLEQLKQVKK